MVMTTFTHKFGFLAQYPWVPQVILLKSVFQIDITLSNLTFLTRLHLMRGVLFCSFDDHMYCNYSVSFMRSLIFYGFGFFFRLSHNGFLAVRQYC